MRKDNSIKKIQDNHYEFKMLVAPFLLDVLTQKIRKINGEESSEITIQIVKINDTYIPYISLIKNNKTNETISYDSVGLSSLQQKWINNLKNAKK
jgi:hypothetical protein